MRAIAAVVTLLATACGTSEPRPTTTTYLTPTEHLARASLALRGIRPSLAELRAVAAEPDRVAARVDRYLESAEFPGCAPGEHPGVRSVHRLAHA